MLETKDFIMIGVSLAGPVLTLIVLLIQGAKAEGRMAARVDTLEHMLEETKRSFAEHVVNNHQQHSVIFQDARECVAERRGILQQLISLDRRVLAAASKEQVGELDRRVQRVEDKTS